MNEGEQGGQGPEGGTPSVLRHSLSPLVSHPPLYSASRGVRGRRGGRQGKGETRGGGKTEKCPPSPDNSEATSTPPPAAAAAGAAKPSRSLCTKAARSECRLPLATPAPPPPASPELSVAQTSPPGPAVPARPSPHAPQTLSNPLGSRRLFREQTLAAAGAGAARLGAGRRRGARYGEPSNEARAGAQRRRVLAEHGRGAAAAVAAGAQGPLHHWQPWSPSIFLPQGRRLGSAHVLGEEGAGARASPEGGGVCASAEGCEPLLSSSSAAGSSSPCCSRGPGGRGPQAAAAPSRRRWWPDGLVQATAADAVQRNERWGWSVSANGAGEWVGAEGGRRAGRGL